MKISDLLEESLLAVKSNKARSGLTILGIVIGISAVVALVSIGSGAKNAITANIESIGSNLIIVMPGFQQQVNSQVRQSRGTAQTLT
ncbi:MAG: ABC transporter permease, partial [bacterium]|nr:ABC transporter permease [bacterium]